MPGTASATGPTLNITQTWQHVLNDYGNPIAEGSPIEGTLDSGGPVVVVGDRAGFLYAYHLSDGSAVSGWPTYPGAPIDSTPSVATSPLGIDSEVFIGDGNAAVPQEGGYIGYSYNGHPNWYTQVQDPSTDDQPAYGVQASLTYGTLQGGPGVMAGSLDQQSYALNAANGGPLRGWPFFTSDSTFSTAALADLYGTGRNELVVGGDQSDGYARGQQYHNGGHLRILSDTGALICHDDTNQTVFSSPAVGNFLSFGRTGIVVGTGAYFSGASDTNTVKAFDNDCHVQWSDTLDGDTLSSPALADLEGNGQLQVVTGTRTSSGGGSVYAIDGSGNVLWRTGVIGPVLGSVVTADLFNQGYQDVVVPTYHGVEILDGKTGQDLGNLETDLGTQNSPLITDDPNGTIGITVAGYNGNNQGVVRHYEVVGSNGAEAVGGQSWPMFHHDPQLTGNAGGTPPVGSVPQCSIPAAAFDGYDEVATDGGVFSFGMPFCGSTGGMRLNAPVVGMAMAPNTGGYWEVASDGGVFAYGGAGFFGSMGGRPLNRPVVGMATTPDGRGYWLVSSDGGIFSFGDADFYGSTGGIRLVAPVVAMYGNPDSGGYTLVASDGGVFSFGDAPYLGSMGGQRLAAPMVGFANDINMGAYWEVASDGGVFAWGGAPFYGSLGGHPLAAPVVGIQGTADSSGYRQVATDGGIFSFSAPYYGSMGGTSLYAPVVGISGF